VEYGALECGCVCCVNRRQPIANPNFPDDLRLILCRASIVSDLSRVYFRLGLNVDQLYG
jgi:hypothetical protein